MTITKNGITAPPPRQRRRLEVYPPPSSFLSLCRPRCFSTTQHHDHPEPCLCALCKKDFSAEDSKAIYVPNPNREKDPKNPLIFTGIVERNDGTYIKLDDPSDIDIQNPIGHVMEEWEYISEHCHLLQDFCDEVSPQKFFLGPIRTDVPLMDFQNHPNWHPNIDTSMMDGIFPFPDCTRFPYKHPLDPMIPKQVRSLDAVLVVAERPNDLPAAFWATVLSVTSTGIVTAESRADVPPPARIKESDLLAFPITAVYGVTKGPNWIDHGNKKVSDRKKKKEVETTTTMTMANRRSPRDHRGNRRQHNDNEK